MPDQIIKIDSLRFGWPGQAEPLLRIAQFDVAKGERLFLHGASGSGKSTLLGLIAGVLAPRSGAIEVLGQYLGEMSAAGRDRYRADHFGIVFQQFNLIPYLSVIENVTLPCHFSALRREKAISRSVNPEDEALRLLAHLDMTDDGLIDKSVTELSVGQQQRVAAARALIGAPEILIADEPTSSMDADRRSAFIELLFRECDESASTLLFVSHDRGLQAPFDQEPRGVADPGDGASRRRDVGHEHVGVAVSERVGDVVLEIECELVAGSTGQTVELDSCPQQCLVGVGERFDIGLVGDDSRRCRPAQRMNIA